MVSTPSQGFDDPPQRPCDPLLPVADPPLRCRSAAFCPKLDCVISRVYDQSPMKNHLGQRHQLVNASRHKITVGGNVPVCKCAAAPRVLRLPERSLNEAAAQTACGSIRATAVRLAAPFYPFLESLSEAAAQITWTTPVGSRRGTKF